MKCLGWLTSPVGSQYEGVFGVHPSAECHHPHRAIEPFLAMQIRQDVSPSTAGTTQIKAQLAQHLRGILRRSCRAWAASWAESGMKVLDLHAARELLDISVGEFNSYSVAP